MEFNRNTLKLKVDRLSGETIMGGGPVTEATLHVLYQPHEMRRLSKEKVRRWCHGKAQRSSTRWKAPGQLPLPPQTLPATSLSKGTVNNIVNIINIHNIAIIFNRQDRHHHRRQLSISLAPISDSAGNHIIIPSNSMQPEVAEM